MMRITIYLSDRKDRDIQEILSEVEEGDRSWFIRELIRDGIKWRKMGKDKSKDGYPATPNTTPPVEEERESLVYLAEESSGGYVDEDKPKMPSRPVRETFEPTSIRNYPSPSPPPTRLSLSMKLSDIELKRKDTFDDKELDKKLDRL